MDTSKSPLPDDLGEGINRNAFEPVYAQLVNILRRQVANGVLRAGDQLPSEAQLCRRYRVSPMTVRRAINILVDQGVVVAEQGRGTFIRPVELTAASFHLQRLQEFFGDGQRPAVKLLEARIVAADERVARHLPVAVGQRVVHLRRLILTDQTPAFYHAEYLIYDPARPIVEAEMAVTSLQGLFGGASSTLLKHGDLSVETTLLTDEEAGLLQTTPPAAAFRIEHLFFDFDDRPISWGWFICRGDRLRFTSSIGVRLAD